jgi:hypothetical protein
MSSGLMELGAETAVKQGTRERGNKKERSPEPEKPCKIKTAMSCRMIELKAQTAVKCRADPESWLAMCAEGGPRESPDYRDFCGICPMSKAYSF